MEQILLKGKPIRLAVLDYGLFELHHGARLMRLAQGACVVHLTSRP